MSPSSLTVWHVLRLEGLEWSRLRCLEDLLRALTTGSKCCTGTNVSSVAAVLLRLVAADKVRNSHDDIASSENADDGDESDIEGAELGGGGRVVIVGK